MTDIDLINLAEINKITDGLIYDRTQADVDYALILERNEIYTNENLKGAYNISDRNRVGGALNYIILCLRNTGRYEIRPEIKDDWDIYDIAKPDEHNKILALLEYLKKLLPYSETEEVPDSLDALTYQKANAVEHILFDLYGVLSRLLDSWFYCGEAFASEFDVWNWQGWDDASNK